jgi:hypothetical protein
MDDLDGLIIGTNIYYTLTIYALISKIPIKSILDSLYGLSIYQKKILFTTYVIEALQEACWISQKK